MTSLLELGWENFFEQQRMPEDDGSLPARVAAHYGSRLVLLTPNGEVTTPTQLAAKVGAIAVGDWLFVEPKNHRVLRRLDRKSEIGRKAAGTSVEHQLIAANVDTLFLVSSCNQDFNLSRMERYLSLVFESDAVPVVVLTKRDLSDHPDDFRRKAEQLQPGLLVELVDARDPQSVQVLENWCRTGKTVGLLGSSGVGKSTLANALMQYFATAVAQSTQIDSDTAKPQLATGPIREADDKGRHTTTVRSLHRLGNAGWLLDTPGMRELQLTGCEEGIAEVFQDVFTLAEGCKFNDCSHQGDAGCALQEAVDAGKLDARRLRSFLKLLAEQAKNAQTIQERRRQDRQFGRMCKTVISHKQRTRRD